MVSSAAAIMKLPAIFSTLARTGSSPSGHAFWPITSKSGATRDTASGFPATTTLSLPASAMSGRPKTGAAT